MIPLHVEANRAAGREIGADKSQAEAELLSWLSVRTYMVHGQETMGNRLLAAGGVASDSTVQLCMGIVIATRRGFCRCSCRFRGQDMASCCSSIGVLLHWARAACGACPNRPAGGVKRWRGSVQGKASSRWRSCQRRETERESGCRCELSEGARSIAATSGSRKPHSDNGSKEERANNGLLANHLNHRSSCSKRVLGISYCLWCPTHRQYQDSFLLTPYSVLFGCGGLSGRPSRMLRCTVGCLGQARPCSAHPCRCCSEELNHAPGPPPHNLGTPTIYLYLGLATTTIAVSLPLHVLTHPIPPHLVPSVYFSLLWSFHCRQTLL